MSFYSKLVFSLRLLRHRKWQYVLVGVGVTFGAFFTAVFYAITAGVENSLEHSFSSSENIFVLRANSSSPELNDELIQSISQRDDIASVYRETSLLLPATVSVDIPFIDDIILDIYFIRGIDDDFFYSLLSTHSSSPHIPVLLDPISLEIFNTFLGGFIQGSSISPEFFSQKSFDVQFGKSSYIPEMNEEKSTKKKVSVQGFSIFAPLLGIAMPYSEVEKLQDQFNKPLGVYSQLYIVPKDPLTSTSIMQEFSSDGFIALYPKSGVDTLLQIVSLARKVLLACSGAVLLLAFLFLLSTLSLSLREHKKTIGILRSLGESKENIIIIFFLQSGVVVSISLLISAFLSMGVLFWLFFFFQSYNISSSLLSPQIFLSGIGTIFWVHILIFIGSALSIFYILWRSFTKDPLLLLIE